MKLKMEEVLKRIGKESFGDTFLAKCLSRLPDVKPDGPWIAGGAVRKTMIGEHLDTDFDFFFGNQTQKDLFVDELVEKGASKFSGNETNEVYILPCEVPDEMEGEGVKLPEMKIQVITLRYYSSLEDVIGSFDFTICQFGWDGDSICVGDFSLWDVARKRLVPLQITYAASSIRRLIKYARQGYTVCGGALGEILNQVVENPEIIQQDTQYID